MGKYTEHFSLVLVLSLSFLVGSMALAIPSPENEDLYSERLYQNAKMEIPSSIESNARITSNDIASEELYPARALESIEDIEAAPAPKKRSQFNGSKKSTRN